MKSIKPVSQTTYSIPNVTDEWLVKNGFRYNAMLSNSSDGKFYTNRFLIYERVIEGEVLVNPKDNFARVEVYIIGTHSRYAPWYKNEYGNWKKMLKIINEKINKKIEYLGMVAE